MKIDINELVKLYSDGYSLNKLKDHFGVHRTTLSKYLKDNNIEIKHNEKSKMLNQNYFDSIDSENKAYILGFICADGSISADHKYLSFDMADRDIDILEKISTELYGNIEAGNIRNRISKDTGKGYSKLTINSKYICEKLLNYNIRKYPIWISEDLQKHFIRGFVDGKGCISVPSDNRESPRVIINCNEDMNNHLLDLFKNKLKITTYTLSNDRPGCHEFIVKSYHNCYILLNWLYSDTNIYSNRKYSLYELFMTSYNEVKWNVK